MYIIKMILLERNSIVIKMIKLNERKKFLKEVGIMITLLRNSNMIGKKYKIVLQGHRIMESTDGRIIIRGTYSIIDYTWSVIHDYERVKEYGLWVIGHELGHLVYAFMKARTKCKNNIRVLQPWLNWKEEIFSDLMSAKILYEMGYDPRLIANQLKEDLIDSEDYNCKTHPMTSIRIKIVNDYCTKKANKYKSYCNFENIEE